MKAIADYEGKESLSPPTEKGKASPYKPAKEFKNPNKTEKGLADSGDSDLVYEPKTKLAKKELGHYPKSENKLSPAKFVEKMSKIASLKSENANLPKLSSNNPHPSEVINFLTECAKSNVKVVENLIHDAKRSGLLYSILECAVSIPETYEILLDILKENKKVTNKFSKLMEEVAPPMEFDDETDDFSDDEDNSDNHMNHDDMDDDHDDMGDEDHMSDDHDDMGDEDQDHDDMGDEHGDMGDEDQDQDHMGNDHDDMVGHDDMQPIMNKEKSMKSRSNPMLSHKSRKF